MKLTFLNRIADIPEEDWDRLAAGRSPFLRHAFLKALKDSGSAAAETGWQPHHGVLYDEENKACAALPLYLKSHSMGEYVFDHGWAQAYQEAGGIYYPKFLSAIPFTPVTCPKILGPEKYRAPLLKELADATEKLGLSSAHLLFLERTEADSARQQNYLIRIDQQFHWENRDFNNFDEFLDTLKSSRRKNIRKERKKVRNTGLNLSFVDGKDITENQWDHFYTFYLETCIKRWGQAYLNRDFFSLIGRAMPENLLLSLAERDGKPIAGALHIKSDRRLFGRYWGTMEYHDFLHFELCYYQALDYAIAHNLEAVEAGAQGGHKLLRGYRPVKTWSAHFILHPGFRDAVASFLKREKKMVETEIRRLEKLTPFKKGNRS